MPSFFDSPNPAFSTLGPWPRNSSRSLTLHSKNGIITQVLIPSRMIIKTLKQHHYCKILHSFYYLKSHIVKKTAGRRTEGMTGTHTIIPYFFCGFFFSNLLDRVVRFDESVDIMRLALQIHLRTEPKQLYFTTQSTLAEYIEMSILSAESIDSMLLLLFFSSSSSSSSSS